MNTKHNKFAFWRYPIFKAVVIFLLVHLVLFAVFFPRNAPNGNRTVYTTLTGECYHKSSCSSLNNSKHRTTLAVAVDEGYRSCDNCDPPELITEDKKTSLRLASIPILILGSLILSYWTWGISVILFKILDIPSNQIPYIWYFISSAVSLVLFL